MDFCKLTRFNHCLLISRFSFPPLVSGTVYKCVYWPSLLNDTTVVLAQLHLICRASRQDVLQFWPQRGFYLDCPRSADFKMELWTAVVSQQNPLSRPWFPRQSFGMSTTHIMDSQNLYWFFCSQWSFFYQSWTITLFSYLKPVEQSKIAIVLTVSWAVFSSIGKVPCLRCGLKESSNAKSLQNRDEVCFRSSTYVKIRHRAARSTFWNSKLFKKVRRRQV